ncbi:MAG: hypothetical protein ACREA9_15190 [Pyrinomonadaceae bacterium]
MIRVLVLLLSSANILLAGLTACEKPRAQDPNMTGRWIIELHFDNEETLHKIQFDAEPSGTGKFLLLDQTSSLNAIVPAQAGWSAAAKDAATEIRIWGPIEFPIGNVGRETGKVTLIGTLGSPNAISGSATFINIAASQPAKKGSFVARREMSGVASLSQAPSVVLLSLNSGEAVLRKKRVSIEWSVRAPGIIVSQQILLSVDQGVSFTPLTPLLDGQQRSFSWRVSDSLRKTSKALLKIVVTDEKGHHGEALTNRTFRIK